jgi:NADH-quinone oxidoreductase subunit E
VRGAPMILDEFKRKLGIESGETTEDNQFTLETVNCVGACALGPIAIADGEYHGQLKTREVDKIIDELMNKKRNGSE